MSLVRRLAAGAQLRGYAAPASDGMWLGQAMANANSAMASTAGPVVTVESAYGVGAVWAAIGLRSDQVGAFPLRVHDVDASGEILEAESSDIDTLLQLEPNPEMTGFDLWALVEAHLCSWGKAFIGKQKLGDRIVALWPILPERVTVRREKGVKVFDVRGDDGRITPYGADSVIHFIGRSLDGFDGISPIALHRQSIGLALALDEYGGNAIGNRAIPTGVLSVKGKIKDRAQANRLRQEWEDLYRGRRKTHRIGILDDEAKFQPVSLPLADAQYIEQRNHSVQDIARIIGVPAEMIGASTGDSATYANVEARSLALLRWYLSSRLRNIELRLQRDRDLRRALGGRVPRFYVDALQRADMITRYRAYRIALGPRQPFMTGTEVRRGEGLAHDTQFDSPPPDAPALPPAGAGGPPAPDQEA